MAESVFNSDWLYRVVYRDIEKRSLYRLQRDDYYVVIRERPFTPDGVNELIPRNWILEQSGLRPITQDECNSHVKKCRGIYPCLLYTFAVSPNRKRVRIGYHDTDLSGAEATFLVNGDDDSATLEIDATAGFTIS